MRISVFDVGGTYIKHGVVEDGHLTEALPIPTEASLGVSHLVKRLATIITEEALQRPLSAVAISTRGQVDTESGTILFDPPHVFPDYTGAPLRELLSQALQSSGVPSLKQIPIIIENDANCAGLGETVKGAGKGFSTCLCVVIGTAIGGAFIDRGKIYHGANFSAGEFGMMYLPDGRGGMMFYEDYASVPALLQLVNQAADCESHPLFTSGEQIDRGLAEGNPAVVYGVTQWSLRVAMGLASLIHIFNPPCLVLGGGIMESPDLFSHVCEATRSLLVPGYESIHIVPASLGNQAGMIGAAHLTEITLTPEEKND